MKNATRFVLCIVLFSFTTVLIAQKRIGIDLATKKLMNLSVTAHYQKVIKKNYLLSYGIFFGNYGKSYSDNDVNLIYNNFRIHSPFSSLNQSITDTSEIYHLLNYNITGKGLGIQSGLGYFHEISVVHGIRANLNIRLGVMKDEIMASYFNVADSTYKLSRTRRSFLTGGICPEINHTIRQTGRLTFYYGIKLPFYFSLNRQLFNPLNNDELFKGPEPEFCIGITRIIGRCD